MYEHRETVTQFERQKACRIYLHGIDGELNPRDLYIYLI